MKILKNACLLLTFCGLIFSISCKSTDSTNGTKGNSAIPVSNVENKKEDPSKNVPINSTPAVSGDKIESIYTDLGEKKCKTTDSNEEEAWIVQECPGVGGYKLEVTEGDLRQTLNLINPNGKIKELDFQQNVSGSFSTLGEKAEWRVKKSDGKEKPFALIVRFNVSENPDKPEKNTSYLVVVKISGESSCITDVVKPMAEANQKARDLADASEKKPCKSGN